MLRGYSALRIRQRSILEIRLATNTLSYLGNDLQYSNARARVIGALLRLDSKSEFERFRGCDRYCACGRFGVQLPSPR
jgi:hypothetical protein